MRQRGRGGEGQWGSEAEGPRDSGEEVLCGCWVEGQRGRGAEGQRGRGVEGQRGRRGAGQWGCWVEGQRGRGSICCCRTLLNKMFRSF